MSDRLDVYTILICMIWTVVILTFCWLNITNEKYYTIEMAKREIKTVINKDFAFRSWANSHGGVYVSPDEKTTPNPYLSHIKDRDIVTSEGKKLTLMNPAYIMRQVMTEYESLFGIKSHITSLKPLNPINIPDYWEKKALAAFEQGNDEATEVFKINNTFYLRMMKPMIIKEGCLKCHAKQGYRDEDIRGGVSASINLEPYFFIMNKSIQRTIYTHILIIFIGIVGICLAAKKIQKEIENHNIAKEALLKLKQGLEQQVNIRTSELQLEISERKKIEEDLVIAKEIAESATVAKSQFIATMSHEIRTPMNAIIGSSKILLEMNSSDDQKKYLNIINAAGNNLLSIINDILDLSKIEAGKIDLEYQDTDLSDIMNNVKNILYPLAIAKGIEIFSKQINKQCPVIKADPIRLKQILLNLGNNAVKFTCQGAISIDVSIEKETDTHVTLSFTVEDTGIGISKDKMNQLFQPFSQVSKVKVGGTGLGLTISKRLIELMGGTIHIKSEEEKGSKFCFVIPFEKGMAQDKFVKYEENIAQNLKILVAEDNIFNQEVIKGLLKNWQLTIVNNGKEAIEILENNSFDVILMDIQMPEMDGLTATKVIRDKNSMVMNHDIPIIAMTAYAMKEDHDLCLNSGMNGYVSKPVDFEKLNSEIKRVFNNEKKNEHKSAAAQFNHNEFLQSVANNKSMALKLIQIFIDKSYPESIDKIKTAIDNKDGEMLKKTSHRFKGAISYFSDTGQQLAFKLQQMGEQEEFNDAKKVYEELKKEVESLISVLRDFAKKLS
ncbi:MAG: DUF3365 domain-containing protein [Desulfobacterales bacterium]|nr:DUF3365 domain-containing protein [Desulfobacterales bacterium]